MMDPPTPNHLPSFTPFGGAKPAPVGMGLRKLTGSTAVNSKKNWSPSFLALDPTLRKGVPFIMKSCACNGADFEEAIG
jgi:hypothetical protein